MALMSDNAETLMAGETGQPGEDTRPVLFVVDSYLPGFGGAELQSVLLARTLREQGIEVHFVAPRLIKELPVDDEIEGFKLTRISYPRVKFLGAMLLMWQFSRYMIRHKDDYCFIHVHITKLLATCLGVVKPHLSAKVMTKISGHAEFTGGILDTSKKTNPAYKVMSHYIRKLDYVQTISIYTREKLLSQGFREEQIVQIPNAVEVSSFPDPECFTNEHDPLVIGFCGRIREVKGLELLVQALSYLDQKTGTKVVVRIAGDGDYRSTIEELTVDLGVVDKVEFLGVVKDVPNFLKNLDIYVQPSYAEGLSNSVLEAMSASLPVVASRISGNVDLVGHEETGYLFESGDSHELSVCLESLINSRQNRLRMGVNGKARVMQGYSAESVSGRLKELYANAVV